MAVEVDGDVLEEFEGEDYAFDADPGGVLEVAGYGQRGYDQGRVSLDLECWFFSDAVCFVLQTALSSSRNSLSTSLGVRYLGLSADEYDSNLSSTHEAISLFALSFVGYTIRWTLSFLSVALNDSAHALSQHTPVLPTEGRTP